MNRKKILVLVLVLLLAVSLVLLVRHRRRQLTRLRPPQAYAAVVRAAAVKRGRLEMSVRYLGEIVPVTESALAAKTTGFIEQILVEEGDPVTAGQLLVRIDDRDIRQRLQALKERERATDSQIAATRARVAGLRAAANTNREIFRRDEILRRQKAIGQEELDIARKNYRLAEAELQAAKTFVIWFTNTENAVRWHKATGYFPIRKSAVDVLKAENWFQLNPAYKAAFDQLLNTKPGRATQGALIGAFPQVRTIIEQAVEKVIAGKSTVDEALAEAKALADKAIQDYNSSVE